MGDGTADSRAGWRITLLVAFAVALLVLGWWLIRSGAGAEDTDGPVLIDPDVGNGPVIGAFQGRVKSRLGTSALPTTPLTGALQVRAREVLWNEAHGREFARAEEIEGRLALGPLHRGDVVMTGVMVSRPTVHLSQRAEGWNYEVVLAELLDDSQRGAAPPRTARLEKVTIRGGTVEVVMLDRTFSLETLDAELGSIAFSGPSLPEPRVVVSRGSAVLVQPAEDRRLAVRVEGGTARILEAAVAFDVARVDVEGARFADVEGVWNPQYPWYGVEATGRAVEVVLTEIEQLLPERARVDGTASFEFRIRNASPSASDVVLSNVDFRGGGSNVTGGLTVRMLPERVELRAADLRLDPLDLSLARAFVDSLPFGGVLRGTVRGSEGDIRFDVAGDLTTPSVAEPFRVRFTGQAAATAQGLALRTVEAELVNVPLAAIRPYVPLPLAGAVTGRIALSGPPTRAPLTLAVDLNLATGSAHVEGTLDLTGAVPAYDLTGNVTGVDLQRLLLPAAPPVLLDGRFAVIGAGTDPGTLDARVRVAGGFRGWRAAPGDTVVLAGAARGGSLAVDTLRLRLSTLTAEATGDWRFTEPASGEIRYSARISSLEPWGPYIPLIGNAAATGELSVTGAAAGVLKNPRLSGEFSGRGVRSGEWAAGSLDLRANVALGGDVPEGRIELSIRDLETPTAGGYPTVTGVVTLARPAFTVDLDAQRETGGSVEVVATGHLPATGPRDLVLERAHVDLAEGRWALATPAAFRWGDPAGRVSVEHFEMRQTAGPGVIRLDGRILPLAEADFTVETAALPLGEVQDLFGIEPYATGQLWTESTVAGPGSAPRIETQFRLEGGAIGGVAVSRVDGTLRYADGVLNAHASAAEDPEGVLELELSLPATIDLTSERKVTLAEDGAVTGALTARAISLAPFAALTPQARNLSGRIDGRVTLGGTVADPAFAGRLVFTDGTVHIPALNQTFAPIQGQLALDGRRVMVEEFTVMSDGPLAVSGTITFEDLTSPVAQLTVRMEQFRPVEVANQPDAAVWGEMTLAGPWDEPVLSGELRVADGYVVIPEFQSGVGDIFADLPSLAAGGGEPAAGRQLVDRIEVRDLVVNVGTDVWFSAEAARAQLGGRVVLNRSGDVLRIQGELEGTRGFYTLQAGPIVRRFEILNARVRFLGTPEVNPLVDITARRVVFDPVGRQIEVEVRIGGTMRTPTLSLASADAPAFPESELLSVLFFGRQTLELGGGGLPGEAVLEATVFSGLAELASLELEEAIVRNLGLSLDIFQVRFGPGGIGGFGSPTFVFGWELGSDFFLTAESAIGALFDETESSATAWALRLEWAFDRRSRARIGLEPVAPYRSLRGFGLAPINRQPLTQQLSIEVRRRWTY